MWTNAGHADFNGATFSLRKILEQRRSPSTSTTRSAHSQDNGGAPESGGGIGGGIMLNPYDLDAFYGDSDFDIRHNLNSNVLVELPFGRGKKFLGNAGALTDALVGGWQVTGIFRYRSGLPTSVALRRPVADQLLVQHRSPIRSANTTTPEVLINDNGNPATLRGPASGGRELAADAAGRDRHARRACVCRRLLQHRPRADEELPPAGRGTALQFRAEAFNAFNNVNCTNVTLDANTAGDLRPVHGDGASRASCSSRFATSSKHRSQIG